MLLEIVSANYVGAYKVFLNFNNGYQATVDLEKTIINESRPIFQPLQKQEYFGVIKPEKDKNYFV